MNEDAARLTTSWKYWSALAGLENATVADDSDRHAFHFQSDQYAFHLRFTDDWWVVDTVDDRNQFHSEHRNGIGP